MLSVDFDPALKERSAYKFWAKEHVRFTDLDALGHVSAVRTNEYFNAVRASLFQKTITNWPHAEQLPVLKSAVIQHEHEMHFPMDIDVGLVIEKWGRTSVAFALAVFNDKCLALSRNIFVFIDARTRLAVPPAAIIKQKFSELAA